MKNQSVKKIVLSAMFISIGIVLPFLTGQIQYIGKMLLPMHIPVLLCAFICGWQYGLAVGFITPILRSFLFSMPLLYPSAIAMAFEMATYGLVVGLLYRCFQKKRLLSIYVSLLVAMISGRIVWGIIQLILLGFGANGFTLQAFIAGAVTNALPGILLQLLLVPAILVFLQTLKKK